MTLAMAMTRLLPSSRNFFLTTRPKLVYAILPHVDSVGHSGDYKKYTESISHADELIWKIWQQIQFNPDYKDKTTLIITTDHGRHTEGVRDGFKSHGDSCEGCRHTYCVMIGPDVKKGFVYQDECFQVDIVPTVGELLGFATPACDGSSLTKALVDRLVKEIPDEQKAYILPRDRMQKILKKANMIRIFHACLMRASKFRLPAWGIR